MTASTPPTPPARNVETKLNRKRRSRFGGSRKHYMEALEARQLFSGTAAPAVQTFYLPFPASSVYQALHTLSPDAQAPISTYASIVVAQDNTQIYYDQWENGFAPDITQPTGSEVYNSVTNPAGVQIWGDGDPSNGSAPGFDSDILHAGDIIVLRSPSIAIPRDASQVYFDGGDKIAATKSVSVGELNYASNTATLLAGALQVSPTADWGVNYRVPMGPNTANSSGMFKYTGAAIMAEKDGTTVKIDLDGSGSVDRTITLNQGETYLVNNGIKMGASIVSDDPSKRIQVHMITGNPGLKYASRWFTLTPIDRWSNSYYTAVSTKSTAATTIFLYNPSSAAITVTGVTRGAQATANLTTVAIKVSAKGSVKVNLPEGSGAHFYTVGGQPFYAISTTDFGQKNYDWGMSLIPENQLTTQASIGLGFGRDPLSPVNPDENGSPVWVTPTGNGNTPETIYVDYNGDNQGPLTDPNGFHYDVALSLKELQRAKIFDPDGNQTGMLLYTLNSDVKLAVSWGEDPSSASAAQPGIDAGSNVDPLPEYDAGKSASLLVDANGDGLVSPGDTLLYTIVVNNISRTSLVDLNLVDNLPSNLQYIPGTTSYTITPHSGIAGAPVLIADSGDTLFPLDEGGDTVPVLTGGATYTVTFQAQIADVLAAGVTDIINTGSVTSPSLRENVPLLSDTPVFYNSGGLVFNDVNRNGNIDTGEPGLSGVTVFLKNGTTVVATTTTDINGEYDFIGISAGDYTIDVDDSSLALVLPNAEETAGIDPSPVTIGGVAFADAGIDGYATKISAIPSTLSGHVTNNGNGVSGVAITLTGNNAGGPIVPMTVMTDANGNYAFLGIMAGTYTVSETQPAGTLDGADSAGNFGGTVSPIPGDQISNIVLPGNAHGINYDFTDINPASVSGIVFVDTNNNGIKDPGENVLPGVLVTLTGSNDLGPIAPLTTTSGANGSYSFGNLRPGTYTITEAQPAGFLDGKDSQNGVVIPNSATSDIIGAITLLPAGATVPHGAVNVFAGAAANNNFGELASNILAGYVFVDSNNNGIKDAGETGISGATLTLTGTDDLGAVLSTTVTVADGSYVFGLLRPGTYAVTETQPAGYFDGKDSQAGTVIPGSATTDVVSNMDLGTNEGTTASFGELLAGNVSGLVFLDLNNNGISDAGENGIAGVLLTLTGANDLGPIAPVAINTDADGSYSFGNLRPGTYTVTESQPSGYVDGKDAKSGVVIAGSEMTDALSGLVISSGSAAGSNTFGELQAGSLSGTVFNDANNNGIKDTGETGIGSVSLTLTGSNDQGAIAPITITTAVDGTYTFGNLRPGTYNISEAQPSGYLDGKDASANVVIANSATTDLISGVVIPSGGGSAGNTFGELAPASLAGLVYSDGNNNGIKEAGEAGIGGVKLTLTGTNDLGVITAISINTAADGSYSFGNLRPGTYAIAEAQPAGYLDGKDAIASIVIANSATSDVINGIVLTSGSGSAGNTFGELAPASLAGFVYSDGNNNGIKEAGEAGIGGVNLTLTGTNDLGVITPISINTAADGSYFFGNLRPGTYMIAETQPAGLADGKDSLGSLGGVLGNDMVASIVVNSGASGTNYNFGEGLASISGIVYQDVTGDGRSADDTPYGGVKVNLYRDDGDHMRNAGDTLVSSTTSADGTGAYAFNGLAQGYYFAEEVVPTGWVRTQPTTIGYYADNLTGATTSITGNDFDNFQICDCKDDVSCLYYIINGCTTVTSLRGNIHQGDTVRAVFTLHSTDTFSLVSYTAPDPTFVADHSSQQVIFDTDSHTFGAGTHSLTVVVPNSYFQIDFICGVPLNILGPAGSNIYYTPQGRLIDADNGGTTPPAALSTPNGTGSITGSVYVDANNNGARNTGEVDIVGIKVTLTGVTTAGEKVKVTIYTDASGNYKFSNLKAGTYKISEGSFDGYHDGNDTAGTKGGNVTNDVISNIVLATGTNATGYLFGEY